VPFKSLEMIRTVPPNISL